MNMKSFLPSLWAEDGGRNAFSSFHKDVDQLFHDFKRGFNLPDVTGQAGSFLAPNIDVSETDTSLEVTAELPGVDEKDIDVTLVDNVLTIKGEKKSETEDTSKDYHVVERSYGSFRRSIRLPFEVEAEMVKADFTNGVLKLSLQKPEETEEKVKKISINQS